MSVSDIVTPEAEEQSTASIVYPPEQEAVAKDNSVTDTAVVATLADLQNIDEEQAFSRLQENYQALKEKQATYKDKEYKYLDVNTFNTSVNDLVDREDTPEGAKLLLSKAILDPEDPTSAAKVKTLTWSSGNYFDDNMATKEYAWGAMSDLADQVGVGDYAQSFLWGFVPGAADKLFRDVTGSYLIDSAQDENKFHDWYMGLSPVGRRAFIAGAKAQFEEDGDVNPDELSFLHWLQAADAREQATSRDMWGKFDVFMGGIDAVAIGKVLGKSTIASKIKSNTYQALSRNHPDAASTVNAEILETGDAAEAAKAVNATPEQVAASSHPVSNFKDFDPDSGDGLAGLTYESGMDLERFAYLQAEADDFLKNNIIGDVLSDADRQAIHSMGIAQFTDKLNSLGQTVDAAEIVPIDGSSFKVVATVDGRQKTETFGYVKSKLDGEFVEEEGNTFKFKITTPITHLQTAFKDAKSFVQTGQINEAQASELQRRLQGLTDIAVDGLSSKEINNLNIVLTKGDEFINPDGSRGIVWDRVRARDVGIPTDSGTIKLSEKEYQRYMVMRGLYDRLLHIQQKLGTDKAHRAGYRGIKISKKDGPDTDMGLPIYKTDKDQDTEEFIAASVAPKLKDVKEIYDTRSGKGFVPVEDVRLAEAYDDGYVLVTGMKKGFVRGEDSFGDMALVHKQDIGDLPSNIYHGLKGYVTRVRDKDNFWIVKNKEYLVNGVKAPTQDAVRSFELPKDREGALKAAILREDDGLATLTKHNNNVDKAAKELGLEVKRKDSVQQSTIDKVSDRELGGLFVGHRSQRTLYHGSNDMIHRIPALEAFNRQVQYVSDRYGMSQFRDQVKAKFMNAANRMGYLSDPNKFDSKLTIDELNPAYKNVKAMQDWIVDFSQMPTNAEKAIQGISREIGEYLGGIGAVPRAISGSILSFSHKNPGAIIRAMAFHPMLGMFNPKQYITQAQGFVIAASLEPTKVVTRWRQFMALRSMLHVDPNNSKVLSTAAKAGGMTADELKNLLKEVKTLGLEAAIRSNQDYNKVATGGKLGFAGSIKDVLFNKGLFFFTEGELITRMYSYMVARSRLLGKDGFTDTLTKKQLQQLAIDTDELTFNMKRINRANWQKGLPSIMTQFKGIHARFAELMLGKQLTTKDKLKIMTGQFVMYGSLGVPFGMYINEEIKAMTGSSEELVTPNALDDFLTGGFLGVITDGQVDTSTLSMGGAGIQMMLDFMEDPVNMMTPPAVTTGSRITDFGRALVDGIVRRPLMKGYEWSMDDLQEVARYLASTTSAGTNLFRMWEMIETDQIRTNSGTLVANDPTAIEIIGKGLGFNPSRVSTAYQASKKDYNLKQSEKEAQQFIEKTLIDFIRDGRFTSDGEHLDPKAVIQFQMIVSVGLHDVLDGKAADRALSGAFKRVFESDPLTRRTLEKLLQRTVDNPALADQALDVIKAYTRGLSE